MVGQGVQPQRPSEVRPTGARGRHDQPWMLGSRTVSSQYGLTAPTGQRPGSAAGAGLPPGRGATGRDANTCRSAATRCSPWQVSATSSPTLPSVAILRILMRAGGSARYRPRVQSVTRGRSGPGFRRVDERRTQEGRFERGRSRALAQGVPAEEASKDVQAPTGRHIGALAPNVQARTAEIRSKAPTDAASGPWPLMFKRRLEQQRSST